MGNSFVWIPFWPSVQLALAVSAVMTVCYSSFSDGGGKLFEDQSLGSDVAIGRSRGTAPGCGDCHPITLSFV